MAVLDRLAEWRWNAGSGLSSGRATGGDLNTYYSFKTPADIKHVRCASEAVERPIRGAHLVVYEANMGNFQPPPTRSRTSRLLSHSRTAFYALSVARPAETVTSTSAPDSVTSNPLRRSVLSVAESVNSHHLGNITSSDGSPPDAVTPEEGGSYADSQEEASRCAAALTLTVKPDLDSNPHPNP